MATYGKFGRRPKKIVVLVFKITWTTLQKRSKNMVFAKEAAFSKCTISKKIRLRRATLPAIIQIVDDVQNNYSKVII